MKRNIDMHEDLMVPHEPPQPRWPHKQQYLGGKRIMPAGITGQESLEQLLERTFLAYNSARLLEACRLVESRMLAGNVTVGLSLSGAMTPAGLGSACLVPLMRSGFVDWIVTTGANMYHDLHFALNIPLHVGSPMVSDTHLWENDVVRIYDVFLSHSECLLATDQVLRHMMSGEEFQKEMGTSELYHLIGGQADELERRHGLGEVSVLAAAWRYGVPVYTSSPGDSAVGMNIAELRLRGSRLRVEPSIDVNETAAIVLAAKREGGKSGVILLGGGSPKNFVLQTEPQIREVLGLEELGHDYFLQVTDARPDTGGLSGATPHEAVSWGKVDPSHLPDAVVCYMDTTVALPLLTHWVLSRHEPRPLKRLYDRRGEMMDQLLDEYRQAHRQ